jgi:micrococcal nuclease
MAVVRGLRRGGPWLLVVAALAATTACDPAGAAVGLTASQGLSVDRVVDGDTVDLSDGRRVRVLGIDTPESVDPDKPVECWGPEATQFARTTLLGQKVAVVGDPTQDAVDGYGRTLAYLTLPGGQDYSTVAAGAGVARARTYGGTPVRKAPQIEAAEADARAAGRGLWGAGCPDPLADTSTQPAQPTTTASAPEPVPVVAAAAAPAVDAPRARVATTTTKATPTKRPAVAPQAVAPVPAAPVPAAAVPVAEVAPTTKKATPKPAPRTTTAKPAEKPEKKAPAPTTKKTTTKASPKPSGGGCDPNYSGGCVPVASDVDCAGGSGNGPAYVSGPVRVVGSDVYGLDADKDGLGCE